MKYRRNNFLRFLLLLAMTVGMFQISAVTAQAATSVTTLDALKTAFSNGGDIKLDAHIIIAETLNLEGGKTLSLDLNGYGILRSDDNKDYLISIKNANFNLYDSRPNVQNYIVTSTDNRAMSVSDNAEGAVEVKGGYLAGGGKGGMYLTGSSKFIMSGGSITHNVVYTVNEDDKVYGCGVYLERDYSPGAQGDTLFIMSGGSISDNTSYGEETYGSGVYVGETLTFNMSGGSISGNKANRGGGVYVDGTFNMSGGSISGNEANQGGGVYIEGTFNMSDGSISGNEANQGSGVYIDIDCTFNMSGGSISHNTAAPYGGGVYVYGQFTISGSLTITDNYSNVKQENVYLSYGKTISIQSDTGLSDNAKIGIAMEDYYNSGVFTNGFSGRGNIRSFFSNKANYAVGQDTNTGEAKLVYHKHEFNYVLSGDSTIVATCTVENDCDLPDHTATLSIGAPVDETGKAVLTSNPEYFSDRFNISQLASSIKYSTKPYTDEDSTPRTADGFHRAKVTYEGLTATVTYGLNCIEYPAEGSDPEHGKVTGAGGKRKTGATVGAVIEPVISPDTGYEINTLTVVKTEDNEPVEVTDNKSFIMPDVNVRVSATFKLTDYKITYQNIVHGRISGAATANYGQSVDLIISPDTGYELVVISVDQESNNNKVTVTDNKFTMPASNVIVNAAFKLADYEITYSSDSNGTISGVTTANYAQNIEVTISPNTGYTIDILSVVRNDNNQNVSVTDNQSFVMPPVAVTVNATFKQVDYKITYKTIDHGRISGAATANYGQSVDLIISPDTGYELVVISVDQESNNNKVTVTDNKFTMPASNVIVNAAFKLTDYAITYSTASHGTISGVTTANYAQNIEVTISPNTGYAIDILSVVRNDNNQNVSVTDNQSFVMPPVAVTVNATFKQIDYEISGNITSGSITVPDTAHYGDKVRFVITPDDGYGISTISIPGVSFDLISRDTDTGVEIYELTMPHKEISINVEFETLTIYTVFYKAADGLTSLRYRFYDAGNGFEMRSDAKAGDVACWAGQAKGAVGREKFPISFKVNDGEWGALTEYNVVNDVSSINNLPEGSAILIAGDNNAFIASFMSGAFDINANGEICARDNLGVKDYFVSSTTTSISVPNPTKTSYDFAGWSYTDDNKKIQTIEPGSGNTTVPIKDKITCTTIFSATWQPESPKVFYDFNGGRRRYLDDFQTVAYKGKATPPEEPFKNGYAFDGWEVKYETRVLTDNNSNTEKVLAPGTKFDFDTMKVIENVTIKARWKHAHDYAYLTLANAVTRAPGIFTQNDVDKYNSHVHFRICLDCFEHGTEPHEFDKNGECYYCGFEDPSQAAVTVEVTINSRDAVPANTYKTKLSSKMVLVAPTRGTDKFVKWEYRSLDGTEWRDLSTADATVIPVPGNVRINAVYKSLTSPELTLSAQHYEDNGILFMLNYTLPTGSTAKNAVVIYGDNYMLGYKKYDRETYPLDNPGLSSTLGTMQKIFGVVGEVVDFGMDMIGIQNDDVRSMVHFAVGIATGEGVDDLIGPLVDLSLEATGLDDTIVGDAIQMGVAVGTGDVMAAGQAACSAAKKYVDQQNAANAGKAIVQISYKGREDNFLAGEGDTKSFLMLKMMLGQGVTVPGNNNAKKHTAKKEDLGQLTGRAYGAYTGIKNVLNGNRFFYVTGYVEYSVPGSKTNKIAVVGPIAVTYNGTNNPVTDTQIQIFE